MKGTCGWLIAGLTLLAGWIGPAAAEDNQLNIYNWADYIGKNTVAEFEKATGIKVVYDTYDSDEALEAKIMAGNSGYDIVSTSASFFGRQIQAGVYEPIDRSKLPNWKNLDPRIVKIVAGFDPDNAHATPYMHGVNGFAYNVDLIKQRMPDAPLDSLDMIFKPEVVAKFADCGVTFLDSPQDVLPLALNYLHKNPNSSDPEDYKAAEKLLLAVRPYIRTFDNSEYLNSLPNKEVCIAMSWSGDYVTAAARAAEAGVKVNLAYTVPKEGAAEWFDALLVPKGAPHFENAMKFLDFMMDPKVIAEVTNDIRYGNDNLAANAFVDPAILANPAIYPTPEVEKRLYTLGQATPAVERLRTRSWTRIKTGH